MKQTEHYGLNQWELTDRILMSDFNADNAKIAEALAGKLGQFEELPRTRYEDEGGFSSRGFPAISWHRDWTNWALTVTTFRPWDLEVAKQEPITMITGKGTSIQIPGGCFLMVFAPFHDPSRDIQGLFFSSSVFQIFHDQAPFQNYEGGSIRNGSHLTGYTITCYGIR